MHLHLAFRKFGCTQYLIDFPKPYGIFPGMGSIVDASLSKQHANFLIFEKYCLKCIQEIHTTEYTKGTKGRCICSSIKSWDK